MDYLIVFWRFVYSHLKPGDVEIIIKKKKSVLILNTFIFTKNKYLGSICCRAAWPWSGCKCMLSLLCTDIAFTLS